MPFSVLGRGTASVLHKFGHMVFKILAEAGAEGFDAWRHSVLSYTSGFGVERFIADAPCVVDGLHKQELLKLGGGGDMAEEVRERSRPQ